MSSYSEQTEGFGELVEACEIGRSGAHSLRRPNRAICPEQESQKARNAVHGSILAGCYSYSCVSHTRGKKTTPA